MSDAPQRPRSTPIPSEPFSLPAEAPPPTPAEYISRTFDAPPAPPPGAAPPPLSGMYPQGDPFQFTPVNQRRRGGCGLALFIFVIAIGPVVGIGVGIWAVLKANDAVNDANDLSDPTLSSADKEALGVDEDVERLFEVPGALVDVFETELPGDPTKFTRILVYSDYAFATVQDPNQPRNLDEYTWRSAKVGSATPQQSIDDVESKLFTVDDVDWDAVADNAANAAALIDQPDASVSHIVIESSVFQDEHPAVIRIFVQGARGSGFVETAPDGTVLAVH